MPILPEDRLAPVVTADPVNRRHRLAKNREGWWLPLPENSGGLYLYDLMGSAHGQLMNPSATGIRWTTSGVRSHAPARSNVYVTTAGTGNRVDVSNAARFQITGSLTVGCWARWKLSDNLSNTPLIAKWGATTGYVLLTDTGSANKMQWGVFTSGSGSVAAHSTAAYGDEAWHRFVANYDGANATLYVDGRQVGQVAATGTINNSSDALVFGTYSNHLASGNSFVGHLDDLFVASRAWSADEVAEDYRLGLEGYPGLLNRLSAATAVVTPPTGNRRRRVLLSAGGG